MYEDGDLVLRSGRGLKGSAWEARDGGLWIEGPFLNQRIAGRPTRVRPRTVTFYLWVTATCHQRPTWIVTIDYQPLSNLNDPI